MWTLNGQRIKWIWKNISVSAFYSDINLIFYQTCVSICVFLLIKWSFLSLVWTVLYALWHAHHSWCSTRIDIIPHVQTRLASTPIDQADTCSARISDDLSNIGCTDGQLPIANVAIPARSARRHRHGGIPLEESRENSVAREFERFFYIEKNSLPLSFTCLFACSLARSFTHARASLDFTTLNFQLGKAFPPTFPACEDRWCDLGLLCSRDRLSVLENSSRSLFLLRFDLLQILGSKPQPLRGSKFIRWSEHETLTFK